MMLFASPHISLPQQPANMSAFSFTAPFITEEEELAEREALAEDERQQIRRDIGLETVEDPPQPSPTPQVLAEKVQQVHELLEHLPLADAYRRALASAAAVVQAETDIQQFLRVEQWNVERAAQRVARYWGLRTDIFGDSILPLTLHGALATESALMSLGLAFVLPNDRHGRAVMYFDRTRFTLRVGTREAFLRVLFYMLYSISLRDNPQFVLVLNVKVSSTGLDLKKN